MARTASGTPEQQLRALAALAETLERGGIDFWLFGGWAVDFWVGRVTRPHDDVDIAAWQRDRYSINRVLLATGWRHTDEVEDTFAASYRSGEALVEFTF